MSDDEYVYDDPDVAPLGEPPDDDEAVEARARAAQAADYLAARVGEYEEKAVRAHLAGDDDLARFFQNMAQSTGLDEDEARHLAALDGIPAGGVLAARDRVEDHGRVDEVAVRRFQSKTITGTAILHVAPPEPLIDGYLSLNSLAILYGPPAAGKSLLTLDWAMSVATGSYWHGHAVQRARVLYAVAEGASGMAARFDAWRTRAQIYGDEPFSELHWLLDAPNMYQRDAAAAFTEYARHVAPEFIVLDTFARCIVGADENAAKDIGVVIGNLERLREATNATVLLAHHTPKSGDGMRGSTAIEGAVDTAIQIKQVDGVVTITATKQKNSALQADRRLAIVGEGDSVILVPPRLGVDVALETLPSTHRRMLEDLNAIDFGEGVSSAQWQDSTSTPKSSFHRAAKQLAELGAINREKSGTRVTWILTNVGRKAIGAPSVKSLLDDQEESA